MIIKAQKQLFIDVKSNVNCFYTNNQQPVQPALKMRS